MHAVDADDAIAMLRNRPDGLKLKKLTDAQCAAVSTALAASRRPPERIEARELTQRGVESLCKACIVGVASLELWTCDLGESDGLVELLKADKLRELHITNILKWSRKGWTRFTEALGFARSLRVLRMYRSSIGVTFTDGTSLWRALEKGELTSLSIGQEFLDQHDFDSIDLALPKLRHLRVAQCNVGAGGVGLARGIAHMPELHTLEPRRCGTQLRDGRASKCWTCRTTRLSMATALRSLQSRWMCCACAACPSRASSPFGLSLSERAT
jgi:hypothetical protein